MSQTESDNATQGVITNEDAPVAQICANSAKAVRLDHIIFTRGEWRKARLRPHPRVAVPISLDKSRHPRDPVKNQISSPRITATTQAVAAIGAQSVLWSLQEYLKSGFDTADLSPVNLSLKAANKLLIPI